MQKKGIPLVKTVKQQVHDLTNNAQLIISYLEMGNTEKSLQATKASIKILDQLAKEIGTAYKQRTQ